MQHAGLFRHNVQQLTPHCSALLVGFRLVEILKEVMGANVGSRIATVNWSNAPGTILDDGTTRTLIVSPPAGNRFYRLKK